MPAFTRARRVFEDEFKEEFKAEFVEESESSPRPPRQRRRLNQGTRAGQAAELCVANIRDQDARIVAFYNAMPPGRRRVSRTMPVPLATYPTTLFKPWTKYEFEAERRQMVYSQPKPDHGWLREVRANGLPKIAYTNKMFLGEVASFLFKNRLFFDVGCEAMDLSAVATWKKQVLTVAPFVPGIRKLQLGANAILEANFPPEVQEAEDEFEGWGSEDEEATADEEEPIIDDDDDAVLSDAESSDSASTASDYTSALTTELTETFNGTGIPSSPSSSHMLTTTP